LVIIGRCEGDKATRAGDTARDGNRGGNHADCRRRRPKHDPEKWKPVFRKDHASSKKIKHDPEKWKPIFRKDHVSKK
jgi:hypothetical protein